MITMKHPNGCVHNVREDLVEKFSKAGWAVLNEQPSSLAEQEEKPKRARAKK